MSIRYIYKILIVYVLIYVSYVHATETKDKVESYHIGAFDPNGVDIVGYTVESGINENLYRFYNFGIPSFAAIGINYYQAYRGNGMTGTVGVGIGSVMYGSIAYQWRIGVRDCLKLGAGLTAGVAYSGAYPVLSYEHRF